MEMSRVRPNQFALVDVDVGGDPAGRHGRVRGEVLRAEQALLLRRPRTRSRRERRGAARRSANARATERTAATPEALSMRAVVDRVLPLGASAPALIAEVIVVRRVDDRLASESFGSEPGITPMTLPDSFCTIAFASAKDTLTPSGTGRNERVCAEARSWSRSLPPSCAIARESSSVAHVRTWTRGEPSSGSSKCSPAQDVWTTCQRIAGRRRRVDEDRAGRSLLRRHQVLVVPAPVPEPRLAREEVRVVLRVVVHHQEDLALEVRVLVVVPLVLGPTMP